MKGWVGPTAGLEALLIKKNALPLSVIEPLFLGFQAEA
jgi:hypothetical protein